MQLLLEGALLVLRRLHGLLSSSPNVPPNGSGCFETSATPFVPDLITFTTDSGNITIYSAPTSSTSPAACNLGIGATSPSNINIITNSGNIEIWGSTSDPSNCVRGNSFANITIDQAITTTGTVFISAQNNITLTANGSIDTPSSVTIIVDNQMPIRPLIGSGSFVMETGSFINGIPVAIYTALQGLNQIDGLINGEMFNPGTLYADTAREMWCTYWCSGVAGVPFTITYKDCLELVTAQAMIVIDQLLANLHPYNEYPGWHQRFEFVWRDPIPNMEPFFIRRRNLNFINHPKSYTVYQDAFTNYQ